MSNVSQRNQSEPIRLFKSDFMEFFTHIHPAVVLAIWLPVAVVFLAWAILNRPAPGLWLHIPIGFVAGWLVWSLTEYLMHRFVFHYHPKSQRMQKFFYLFHGVHHDQPMCKTRLVMPPAVSVPLAAVFYGLFVLVVDVILGAGYWVAPLFSGFIMGYLAYDMTHYATHHFPVKKGYFAFVRKQHMRHHVQTPDMRFGVSSPLWDIVFGTLPKENKSRGGETR